MRTRNDLRAADADRQAAAERLSSALSEGRLDLDEYDQRVRHAYAARTYGELDQLMADLPPATPPTAAQTSSYPPPVRTRRRGCLF